MSLEIEKCVVRRCSLRLRQALNYSTGVSEKPVIQVIIAEICAEGFSGFGEFNATSLNYQRGIPGTSALEEWDEILNSCSSLLGKDALGLRRLIPEEYNDTEDASGIVDCLDFALYDLVGRAKGIPAWALLGGRRRISVPVMPVIHEDETQAMVSKARDWQERWGLRFFKLKPHVDLDADVKMMKEFSEKLRPGTKFLLAANYAYRNVEEAVQTLTEVAKFGVFLAEDPLKADYRTYQETLKPGLNRAGVKLMLDQQARETADVFEIVAGKSADVINFHANWHSGFFGALDKATVVQAGGMENFVGSSIYAGIADAANILLSSVMPALVACEQVRGSDFYLMEEDSVADTFYDLRDGCYHIHDRPGLGIEVDGMRLERPTEEKVLIAAP